MLPVSVRLLVGLACGPKIRHAVHPTKKRCAATCVCNKSRLSARVFNPCMDILCSWCLKCMKCLHVHSVHNGGSIVREQQLSATQGRDTAHRRFVHDPG